MTDAPAARRWLEVNDRDGARAAAVAAAAAGRPVGLVSAPGAAAWLGPAVFARIVEEARAAAPDADVAAVLDCGDSPGLALAALAAGLDAIALDPVPARDAVAAFAAARGARLVPRPTPDRAD